MTFHLGFGGSQGRLESGGLLGRGGANFSPAGLGGMEGVAGLGGSAGGGASFVVSLLFRVVFVLGRGTGWVPPGAECDGEL